MKLSKKLLSLFLVVVMIASVFTVMPYAYTVGSEVAGNINYRYTVEKVDTVPATDAGSEEYTADNIYAVTVWAKCDLPMMNLTMPVHYDKTLFAPITLVADGVTYPVGAGLDPETYYTDMGEGALYAYSFGDYMNNTGMYKANGTEATTKALAKCIGLGNANSAGIDVMAEYLSPDHSLYATWNEGLPENTGIMYANIKVTGKTKTAYFNTISGIETNTGWNRMFTFYFESLDGVSAVDALGAEFGVYTDDCFTVDGTVDEAGYGYFVNATTTVVGNPTKNIVSNAVLSPVYNKTSQIRYTGAVNGDYAPFDIRSRARIDADLFKDLCGDDAEAEGAITAVGFVFADATAGTFDMAAAKAVVESKTDSGIYKYVECTEIVKNANDGDYFWSCLVTGAEYEGEMNAMGFITVGGTTYYVNAEQYTDFSILYDTYATNIPA